VEEDDAIGRSHGEYIGVDGETGLCHVFYNIIDLLRIHIAEALDID